MSTTKNVSAKSKDLLIEIGTEEIPANSLQSLSQNLLANIKDNIAKHDISYTSAYPFATPRRLGIVIKDLATIQPMKKIIHRGPPTNIAFDANHQPTKATLGFIKKLNIDVSQLKTENTPKGSWLYYEQTIPGSQTINCLAEIITASINSLTIPKKMRWHNYSQAFIRPVHWLLGLFGEEIVNFSLFNINSSNITYGHRFHHPNPISITTPSKYKDVLLTNNVIADFSSRKKQIAKQIKTIEQELNCQAILPQELLDEVTGLTEWPQALSASFNSEFLQLPKPCLVASMQEHQKCFALQDKNGKLLPKFILITNIKSDDYTTIINGNQKVMHARLQDAMFYFAQDKKQPLEKFVEPLKAVVFQKQLGSMYAKILRVQKLAEFISEQIATNQATVSRAAFLCKADLMTSMVFEFPELQGIMGEVYALASNESKEVATAIAEHYQPAFADDNVPTSKAGICIALADKLDSLAGFFSINKIPSGDKDPFALRRQALAIVRILIENKLNLDLKDLFAVAIANYNTLKEPNDSSFDNNPKQIKTNDNSSNKNLEENLITFCYDRLQAWYNNQSINNKIFAAVNSLQVTKPFEFSLRILAVNAFVKLPAANNLAAANKRVHNILNKTTLPANIKINHDLFANDIEKNLFTAIQKYNADIKPLITALNFSQALLNLSNLKDDVDNFFDQVMVMVDDVNVKNNRLLLLQQLQQLFLQVADISGL